MGIEVAVETAGRVGEQRHSQPTIDSDTPHAARTTHKLIARAKLIRPSSLSTLGSLRLEITTCAGADTVSPSMSDGYRVHVRASRPWVRGPAKQGRCSRRTTHSARRDGDGDQDDRQAHGREGTDVHGLAEPVARVVEPRAAVERRVHEARRQRRGSDCAWTRLDEAWEEERAEEEGGGEAEHSRSWVVMCKLRVASCRAAGTETAGVRAMLCIYARPGWEERAFLMCTVQRAPDSVRRGY